MQNLSKVLHVDFGKVIIKEQVYGNVFRSKFLRQVAKPQVVTETVGNFHYWACLHETLETEDACQNF